MKQIIIGFTLLVGSAACTEEVFQQDSQSYTITWKDAERSASAVLNLRADGTAKIIVTSPDQYFFHRKETVSYLWNETDSTFTLEHEQNGFKMEYAIVYRDENSLTLNYHNELTVEMIKATSSPIVN